jgi:hypothetical protein
LRFYELCIEEIERVASETGRDPRTIVVDVARLFAEYRRKKPVLASNRRRAARQSGTGSQTER